jgi:flavin reductase (DIM6/NTAB) family NADH-FMN oxidoreductase RutF
MEIDPSRLPIAERYKLLIGCIVPRPIALVSSVSAEGKPNLAPFSFFNGIGSDPMTLLFCPVNAPDGSPKDTLRNVAGAEEGGTGEFVVNAATEGYAREMAACAEGLPHGESEFELSGLTPAASAVVRPPRVARSPVALECRTRQIVRLNPGKAGGGNVVIGEVVHVFVRDDLIDDRLRVDPERLGAIGRMGGPAYTRTRERFEMPMGRVALRLPEPF